jgi:predicted CopG family antitoxin
MSYKTVKVSRRVYERLQELARELNVESPSQALERLLFDLYKSTAQEVTSRSAEGVTSSTRPAPLRVRAEMLGHPWGFWRVIVGEGYDSVVFALPRIALEGMCGKGLLHPDICRELYEAFRRAEAG